MKKNYEIIYKNLEENEKYESTIKQVINECFKIEKLEPTNLYISITLTNSEEIEKINRQYRNIDRPTDVLSFPMFEKEELDQFINENSKNTDVNVQGDILGDIVISVPKVYEQAEEYGHSFERELAYMVVHGFYHLMGYDHIEDEDQKVMREKEEYVLENLGIKRETSPEKSEKELEKIEEDQKNKKDKTSNSGILDAWKNAINGIIYHPKAKIAKDVAAGGVVIAAINAIIVAYFLFFDKISDIGLNFIENVVNSPIHLAFATLVIVVVAIVALIATARTNKHKE